MFVKHFAFVALTLGAFANAAPVTSPSAAIEGAEISEPSVYRTTGTAPLQLSDALLDDNASVVNSNNTGLGAAGKRDLHPRARGRDEADKWLLEYLDTFRLIYTDSDVHFVGYRSDIKHDYIFTIDEGEQFRKETAAVDIEWSPFIVETMHYNIVVFKGKGNLQQNGNDGGARNWAWWSNDWSNSSGVRGRSILFGYGSA